MVELKTKTWAVVVVDGVLSSAVSGGMSNTATLIRLPNSKEPQNNKHNIEQTAENGPAHKKYRSLTLCLTIAVNSIENTRLWLRFTTLRSRHERHGVRETTNCGISKVIEGFVE